MAGEHAHAARRRLAERVHRSCRAKQHAVRRGARGAPSARTRVAGGPRLPRPPGDATTRHRRTRSRRSRRVTARPLTCSRATTRLRRLRGATVSSPCDERRRAAAAPARRSLAAASRAAAVGTRSSRRCMPNGVRRRAAAATQPAWQRICLGRQRALHRRAGRGVGAADARCAHPVARARGVGSRVRTQSGPPCVARCPRR